MASSSKVRFMLEDLQARALAAMDKRIEAASDILASMEEDPAFSEEVDQWRARQADRLRDLLVALPHTTDEELAAWRVDPAPKRDTAAIHRARRTLADLWVLRGNIEAKSASLIADEDGGIALTKTQLSEFFYL